jgi:hypothetical protein
MAIWYFNAHFGIGILWQFAFLCPFWYFNAHFGIGILWQLWQFIDHCHLVFLWPF